MDLFVGSIPFKFKEKDLSDLFAPFGEVAEVKIIISNITRQNKGFGFVIMPKDEEAKAAIEALNGKEIEGRNIVVAKSEGNPDQMTKKLLRHGNNSSSGPSGKGISKHMPSKGGFNKPTGGRKGGGSTIPKGGSNRGS